MMNTLAIEEHIELALGHERSDIDAIEAVYSADWRRYHDWNHVLEMVHFCRTRWEGTREGLDELVAACVFHDFCMDTRNPKGVNESRSAAQAIHSLLVVREWSIERTMRVANMILESIDHRTSMDDQTQTFLEADLERFTTDDQPYWDAQVRLEYPHVTDEQWLAGRERVLDHYLCKVRGFRIGQDSHSRMERGEYNILQALRKLRD